MHPGEESRPWGPFPDGPEPGWKLQKTAHCGAGPGGPAGSLPLLPSSLPKPSPGSQVTARLSPHPPPASWPHSRSVSCPSNSMASGNLPPSSPGGPTPPPWRQRSISQRSPRTLSSAPYRGPPPAPRHPDSPSPSPRARGPTACSQACRGKGSPRPGTVPRAGRMLPQAPRCSLQRCKGTQGPV